MFGNTLRARLRATAALAALLLAPLAHAGTVDFTPVVGTIDGPSNTVVFTFDVLGTGSTPVQLVLTDLESPAPFQLLGLGLADDSTGFLLADTIGEGVLTLNFTVDPGRYLALVGGVTDSSTNIGTFGLEISAVPIPGAAWLLGSALLGPGLFMRRRQTAEAAVEV